MLNNNTMEIREKLIEVAKRYSNKVIQEFTKTVGENITLNVYISGSISYGYCNEMSDIEMEFYLPDETAKDVKEKLQKIIDDCSRFEEIRMSTGVSQWPLEKIVHGDIEKFWKNFKNPYQMYELMTAMPVREDMPFIEKVKSGVNFYPSDLLQRIIKGLWLTINDSGVPYNADWSYKRGQLLPSNIFFFGAMEAVLRLAYLLNKKYYPHTKWLEKGLGDLQNDFGLMEFAKNIEKMGLKEKLEAQQKIIKEMVKFMIDNSILSRELIDNPWIVIHQDYYIFCPFWVQ